MEIGSYIKVSKEDRRCLGLDMGVVTEDLTLPNPEYLNAIRFRKGRFYKPVPKTISYLYTDKEGNYILPRYYLDHEKYHFDDTMIYGRDTKFKCLIKLRDYQQEFFDANQESLLDFGGNLIEAACGSGKTIIGIYLSYLRAKQTLVLVPTYFLAKQWKQRIEETTDASVIILDSKVTEFSLDSDFTIVVMDLFGRRVFPEEFIKNIGHVILDEAHRVGAETYLPILDEVPAAIRTALTATFRRTDNVHRILQYHFGKKYKMDSRFPAPAVVPVSTGVMFDALLKKDAQTLVLRKFFEDNEIPFTETDSVLQYVQSPKHRELADKLIAEKKILKKDYLTITKRLNKGSNPAYTLIDTYLSEHGNRNRQMQSLIRKALREGRTILFLSKRKATLKKMATIFAEYKPMVIISETKDRTPEEEEYLQNECPLILGVVQLAKEGLDIDRLDTLIIHLPMKDVEQALGRISRLHPHKKSPVAIYPLDTHPIPYAVYNNAREFFSPTKVMTVKTISEML